MRHTKERARFYEIWVALYEAALQEMPEKKRRSPHYKDRVRRTAYRSALAMSNRAQRRALGQRGLGVTGRMDIPKGGKS